MEQPSVSNKSYELLGMSESESSSSVHISSPQILTSPRKKKYRKFQRDKFVERVTLDKCYVQTRTICVFFVLSVLIVWLLTMSWFISALQSELDKFNRTIITIAAGNQGVPDDLQKCHAMSKQLQINQTDIYQRLSGFTLQITNLTQQVKQLHTSLLLIEKRIPTHDPSPDVRKDLSAEVAKFGSELKDLNINVQSLKENTNLLQSKQKILEVNITQIADNLTHISGSKLDDTIINRMSDKLQVQIIDLNNNFTSANQNFLSKLGWLSQDQKKDKDDIEKLKEKSEKMLAQLQTIESKYQISEDEHTKKFADTKSEVFNLKNRIDKIASNVTNLHAQSIPDNSIVKSSSQLPGSSNSTIQLKP